MEPKAPKNRSKIHAKIDWFFYWFWMRIRCQHWSKTVPKSLPKPSQKSITISIIFSSSFRCDFGWILAPLFSAWTFDLAGRHSKFVGSAFTPRMQTIVKNGSQNGWKSMPKLSQNAPKAWTNRVRNEMRFRGSFFMGPGLAEASARPRKTSVSQSRGRKNH